MVRPGGIEPRPEGHKPSCGHQPHEPHGAGHRTRTRHLRFTRAALSLMSYTGMAGAVGIEPTYRGPKPRVLPLDDAPKMEGVTGVEPACSVWKTDALPLSYTPLVRQTGLEPATSTLATWRSPIELLPLGGWTRNRTGLTRVATAHLATRSSSHGCDGRARTRADGG